MTTFTPGRWLLVVLAIVGLAFAVPAVSAHGDGPTADDAPPTNTTADEWAVRMDAHMTDQMGPGAVAWMEAHMGLTVEEMAEDMVDGGTMDSSAGMSGAGGMGAGGMGGAGGGHC